MLPFIDLAAQPIKQLRFGDDELNQSNATMLCFQGNFGNGFISYVLRALSEMGPRSRLVESHELLFSHLLKFHSIHSDSSQSRGFSFPAICRADPGNIICFWTGFFGGSFETVHAAC